MNFLISCRRALSSVPGRPLSSLPKPVHSSTNRYPKLSTAKFTAATAKMTDKTYTLNNGVSIPTLGLGNAPLPPLPSPRIALTPQPPGTWQSAPGKVKSAVSHAIRSGYRLIDGAYCYGNEDEVGQGIQEALASGDVKREDLFVVSKVWTTYNTRVEAGLDKSLKDLGLDYVDLFLVVSFPLWQGG